MQIIAALQMNEVDYQSWGIWKATFSSAITHATIEDVEIPYPHIYVYRETEDDDNPRLDYGQQSDFPSPDLSLETKDGQTIDFYYLKNE